VASLVNILDVELAKGVGDYIARFCLFNTTVNFSIAKIVVA
jgi:hypothetical protein